MDAIIAYVNGNDPVWLESYTKNIGGVPDLTRFRDYGTLKYIFRGIDEFMPFVDRILLVVSSDSQVPEFVNKNTVTIIKHEDFIPHSLLPTFNCNPIELYMPCIDGLSEQFLYFNDDFFVLKPCKVEDFFIEGKPRISFRDDVELNSGFGQICKNSSNIANIAVFGPKTRFKGIFIPQHIVAPMIRSKCLECLEKVGKIAYGTLGKTRDGSNVNQYLYTDYFYLTKYYTPQKIDGDFVRLSEQSDEALKELITKPKTKILCINDANTVDDCNFNDCRKNMLESFEILLPNPSKYER